MSRREFQYREGTSHKFWAITVEGKGFTVQFGKVGTAGQTQTKEFASDAEARTAADKLIAEKTKKGYAEVGAATAAAAAPAPAAPRPAKAKAVAAPAPAAPAAPTVTRRVDVPQPEWLRLRGQPWKCQPRPPAPPFDLAGCLERFRKGFNVGSFWNHAWDRCRIAPTLTPPEARFWLEAMCQVDYRTNVHDLAEQLAKEDYESPFPPEKVVARVTAGEVSVMPDLALPLSNLLPLEEFFDLIVSGRAVRGGNWSLTFNLMEGFHRHALPYVTAEEAEKLRAILREHLDPTAPNAALILWLLAAVLGLHDELLAHVKNWKDGQCAGNYWSSGVSAPHTLLFHVGDANVIQEQFRRVKLPLVTDEHIHAWLLVTGTGALDYVRDSILGMTKKDDAERAARAFAAVQAPEAAPHMLELRLGSKAAAVARQWLDDNPGNAIAGLIPVAAGKGKLAEAAVEYLREAKKRGRGAFIEEQLKGVAPDVAGRVRQEVTDFAEKVYQSLDAKSTPDWLRKAFDAAPRAKPPDWPVVAGLPPLLVGGRQMSQEQAGAVLLALKMSNLSSPHSLVTAMRANADRRALAAFAWKMFETWLGSGAPSKEKWVFTALGHFGDDAAALRLTPLLRAWPGESQHQRAVTGLEILRAIGSDTALMQLNGMAQKLKFKGLQNKAKEMMEAIATDRGLTRDQLEDRIVPDLDLDGRGGRTFDFGPRQFHLVLGDDLKPQIKDDAGKIKADLPKPGTKDDAAKAGAAVVDWKLLKKQLRDAVKVQAFRLEQTMVTGRRWPASEFETLLVRHPLMVNLVRRLLWGGHDGKGRLVRTFRVTEEQEYADVEDRPCPLDGVASVGVVHPLHLTAEQRAAWGQVFGDYEVISPFPQLGRLVFGLEGAEAGAREITRFAGRKIPGVSVVGALEGNNWQRGRLHDHGDFDLYYKQFPSGDVTAAVHLDPGLWAGQIAMEMDIQLTRCVFLRGQVVPDWWTVGKEKNELPLKDVDPVVLSEVLGDLTTVASKAK
jgi:predicted DNA-binding WGR domain protein